MVQPSSFQTSANSRMFVLSQAKVIFFLSLFEIAVEFVKMLLQLRGESRIMLPTAASRGWTDMTGLASSAGAADSKFAKFRGKFLHDWPDFGGEKRWGDKAIGAIAKENYT